MPKKNTFISELKSIIASSNYSFNDVPEEVIPVFVSFFEALTDVRNESYILHKLSDIVGVAFFGIISGCNTWNEIEVFGDYHLQDLKKYLELKNGCPSHDTFRRVFNLIKPSEFGEIMVMVLEPIISKAVFNHIGNAFIDDNKMITDILSMDGKVSLSSSRNRRDKDFIKALNTMHVHSTELGITLVSEPIENKTNEIPVGRKILQTMDLRGKVITCDALNTQKELTEIITKSHGEYVLPVKENQKNLKDDIELYFKEGFDKTKVLYKKEKDKESSKIVTREYYLSPEVTWCYEVDKWTNIHGFGMIKKTVEDLITKEISEEKRYFISSFNDSIELFSRAVRNHWSVEIMHRDLDMFFDEDDNMTIRSNALLNFNTLKKVVLSILKLVQGFYGEHFSKNSIRQRISYGFGKEIESIFKSISYLITKKAK